MMQEQLENLAAKKPEAIWKTPAAAIYGITHHGITHDAIARAGATSIPEALHLAPAWK
jgi:hypothetical protein